VNRPPDTVTTVSLATRRETAHYYLPTNNKVEWTTMKNVPLTFIDPAQALDMQGKWGKTCEKNVTKRTTQ